MRTVTVIGSGNAFNTDGRAHACYLLENSHGETMLLDIGATSLQQLQLHRVDLQAIRFLLLTHFHGDHFGGLPFLLLELDLVRQRRAPLIVAGPPGVEERCRALMEVAYPAYFPKLRFPVTFLEVTTTTRLGAFSVQPFPVEHQPESTGYRVTGPEGFSFAFSGDSACNEQLFELVRGVDVAIVELSMFRQTEPRTAHVSLEEAVAFRHMLSCKRLIWSHIYDELAEAVRTRNLGETASDGMVINFGRPG